MWRLRRLNQLAIARPCTQSWEEMPGDDRQRFCISCNNTVHNLSALTRRETARLIHNSHDGLCARVVRDQRGRIRFRPDAADKPLSRFVQLSALGLSSLGLEAAVSAQTNACKLNVKAIDPMNAPIPGASVTITPRKQPADAHNGTTGSDGGFSEHVVPGEYTLSVEAPGFARFSRPALRIACPRETEIVLQAPLEVGTVGGVALPPPLGQRLRLFLSRFRHSS